MKKGVIFIALSVILSILFVGCSTNENSNNQNDVNVHPPDVLIAAEDQNIEDSDVEDEGNVTNAANPPVEETDTSDTNLTETDTSESNSSETDAAGTGDTSQAHGVLPQISVMDANNSALAGVTTYKEYIDNPDGIILAILSEDDILDFAFISIGYDVIGDSFSLYQQATLEEVPLLPANQRFLVHTLISEGIPTRGIRFTFEGNHHYFYISEDTVSGQYTLVEFTYD